MNENQQQQPQQDYQQPQGGYQQPQQQPYGQPQYQQPPQPQQPQMVQQQSFFTDGLSTGDKVLYCLLGVFVPIIGIICLYCSTKNGYNGIVRDKAKWLLIGAVISLIVGCFSGIFGIFPTHSAINIINATHI